MSPKYLRHRSHTFGTPKFWSVFSAGLDLYMHTQRLGLNQLLDEMNEGLGYDRYSTTIQAWMREGTIPRPTEVEYLAQKIISHTNLDRGWVQILYNVAGYEMPIHFKEASITNAVSSSKAYTNISSNEQRTASIFISYARVDLAIAKDIHKILVRKGHNPWIDIYSIRGGEDWLRAIYRGIDECEIFLAVLSNNSVSKRGVIQKELKQALDKWEGMLPDDIYIVPVRIDDCPIPELLKHIQVLDWDDGNGESKLLEAVRVGLTRRKDG
jgi:TIR domain-containing protein